MDCILCGSRTEFFKMWRENEYRQCSGCSSILLNTKDYVNAEQEKERYQEHNNDVEDKRYQKFVSPIVDGILNDYGKYHVGLDFGSGTGPVISKLLKDKGYNIKLYDPFFANYPCRLKEKYDYIACCEVIEHFHHPLREFKMLKELLKPGGSIYIMTSLYSHKVDFISWNYKDDITHVFIYHRDAIEWIKNTLGFSKMEVDKNFIKLSI